MDMLTTATGKTIQCDYFNLRPESGRLRVQVSGIDMTSVAAIFSNSQETMQLSFGNEHAVGYTEMVSIMPAGDEIRVLLRRP
nr:MAG TPA: hypothetical protein [Caudoviricetes sp.]